MSTAVQPGQSLNEDARMQRTNKVLAELLKNGKAEVSDLSLGDVARLSQELGWSGEPRFEFNGDKVYVSAPGRRRTRQPKPVGRPVTDSPQA